jgi:hypothetical protein
MKYKNIKSMLHNFAHSFVSLMNYYDDTYIIDILPKIIKKSENKEVKIYFPSGKIDPPLHTHKKKRIIEKSIAYYKDWLPKHAQSHNVELERLSDIHITGKKTFRGVKYRIKARDDRGVEYDIHIRNTI